MKIQQFTLGLLLLLARSAFASEAGEQEKDGKGHPRHGGPHDHHEDQRGKEKLKIPNQKQTPQLGGTKYCVVFDDAPPATMALTRTGLAVLLLDQDVEGITSGGGCDDCCNSGCMEDCDCVIPDCVTLCEAAQCHLVDTGGH